MSKLPPEGEFDVTPVDEELAVEPAPQARYTIERESSISENLAQLESILKRMEGLKNSDVVESPGYFPQWLTSILQGVTLATVVGCAFWLGSLSNTVSRSAEKVDKLNDAVMGVGKDGISNRLSVIETKLDGFDKKLDQVARPQGGQQ